MANGGSANDIAGFSIGEENRVADPMAGCSIGIEGAVTNFCTG